jgi:cytohesin
MELEPLSAAFASRTASCVVVGLQADRFGSLADLLNPGDHVFPLPRLVDETALHEIIAGTFSILRLVAEPNALDGLRAEAVRLALDSEASILPLLSVTLAELHDSWRQRYDFERKWRDRMGPDAAVPPSFTVAGFFNPDRVDYDILVADVTEQGGVAKSIERLGERAWAAAEALEGDMRSGAEHLAVSQQRQKLLAGEIRGRDFVLARLLRQLVVVSTDEGVPDRLIGMPDSRTDDACRALAEIMRQHRLLTRRGDGDWWLVHLAVLRNWPRAQAWREAELQAFRIQKMIEADFLRWREEIEAGEADTDRWLWTRGRQLGAALDWLVLRGRDDNPSLAAFVRKGSIESVHRDPVLIPRVLRVATYFNDPGWVEEVLASANMLSLDTDALSLVVSGRALSNASAHGDVSMVRRLLRAGANPSQTDGVVPLVSAAQSGSLETCRALLEAGALVDQANPQGWTALLQAAASGHAHIISLLVKAGADLKSRTDDDWTALPVAAANGHRSAVDGLIAAGAPVNYVPEPSQGSQSVSARADVTAGNPFQARKRCWSALYAAAQAGHAEIVDHLLDAGADTGQLDEDGVSALEAAAFRHHEAVVEVLLTRAALPQDQMDKALHRAAQIGNVRIAVKLLMAGASLNSHLRDRSQFGDTPLFAAAALGHIDLVRELLAAGADPNIRGEGGGTPLLTAVDEEHAEIVQLLLAKGAAPMAQNDLGLTPLILAYKRGNMRLLDLMLQAGAQPLSDSEVAELMTKRSGGNIGLVVNARGKVCLVHDTRFEGIPLWVGYHCDRKQIEIMFEDGSAFLIDWKVTDEMESYITKIDKILMIRMRNGHPIEGYDTSLVQLLAGRPID